VTVVDTIHEKSATLHYINLAFIPCDRDVAPPKKNPPLFCKTKSTLPLAPQKILDFPLYRL